MAILTAQFSKSCRRNSLAEEATKAAATTRPARCPARKQAAGGSCFAFFACGPHDHGRNGRDADGLSLGWIVVGVIVCIDAGGQFQLKYLAAARIGSQIVGWLGVGVGGKFFPAGLGVCSTPCRFGRKAATGQITNSPMPSWANARSRSRWSMSPSPSRSPSCCVGFWRFKTQLS